MAGELHYRKDLFRGTAEYYDQFRPSYPRALLDDLRARVPIPATARLLDLASGTGQVAFEQALQLALAPDRAEPPLTDEGAAVAPQRAAEAQDFLVSGRNRVAAFVPDQ